MHPPYGFGGVQVVWGRPWRIEMRELNAAAMGDYDLPVTLWNPTRQRYEIQR